MDIETNKTEDPAPPLKEQPAPPPTGEGTESASLIQRGNECFNNHAFYEAAAILAYAATLAPKDASLWNNLGRAYHALRAEPRAIQAYQQAIILDPKSPWAYNNLGLALQADGHYQEAEAAYRKQIDLSPKDQYSHKNLGNLLVRLGREREAIPEFEMAAQIRPQDVSPLIREGIAHLHLSAPKTAMEIFNRALKVDSSAPTRNAVAYGLALGGEALESARTWAEQAVAETEAALAPDLIGNIPEKSIKTTSQLTTQWDTLGWVLFRQGDLAGARPYLDAAARLGGLAEQVDHFGQLSEALGNRAGAIQAYARALTLPDPPEGVRERLGKLTTQAEAEAAVAKSRQDGGKDLERSLAAPDLEPGAAEFDCWISNDGKVLEAHLRSGLESLKPLETRLREVRHPFSMPRTSQIKCAARIRVEILRGSRTATVKFLDTHTSMASKINGTVGSWTSPVPSILSSSLTKQWALWAGKDGVSRGFTTDRIQAYLEAKYAAIVEPMPAAVMQWLKDLSGGPDPSLSTWAMARRLEAGDFSVFPSYSKAVWSHVYGISKPGSGRSTAVLRNPPMLAQTTVVEQDSPFWKAFFDSIKKELDQPLDGHGYAVWSYGTRPEQRALILETASRIKTQVTIQNPTPDPWNDPRFWIVTDWALAWGKEKDFKAIEEALPEGWIRNEFTHIHQRVGTLASFWGINQPPAKGQVKDQINATSQSVSHDGRPEPEPSTFKPVTLKALLPAPSYPQEAKSRGMMSFIVLSITVGEEGVPLGAKLLPGPWLAFFGPTAYEYGMRLRFEPAKYNNVPTAGKFYLTMPFHLY